jgi:hypothetical protein
MTASQALLKEEMLAKMETRTEANNEKFKIIQGTHLPNGCPPCQERS